MRRFFNGTGAVVSEVSGGCNIMPCDKPFTVKSAFRGAQNRG
jgi:hypothetical protein